MGNKSASRSPRAEKEPQKPEKIIFLDIDGVLNNAKSDISQLFIIEKDLLQILKKIIAATNASLVLSSTWRYTEETRSKVYFELK